MGNYIAVAGNMGVGKSTLVQFMSEQFGGRPFYEPENPYLGRFFKDMKRWSFHSQVYYLTHKFRLHREIDKMQGTVFLDRSIYEDAEIFARGLYLQKKMTKEEFKLYWDLYESMIECINPPTLLIYLTCSMKTLQERIAKRGRVSEKDVPIAYLRGLQRKYDKWVSEVKFCEVINIVTDDLDYLGDLLHRKSVIDRLKPYLNLR